MKQSKSVAFLLALVLVLGMYILQLPTARAETVASGTCGAQGNNLTWTLDDSGVLTISGSGAMADYTGGTAPWYAYRENIREVVFAAQPEADAPVVEESVTITFDDTAKRISGSSAQQVWQENGITVTNDKAASTTNVNVNYYNPIRCYQNSSLKVEYAGMVKLVFDCPVVSYGAYATGLVDSITGATATADGNVVTVELPAAADSFLIESFAKQVRISSITVYTAKQEAAVRSETTENLATGIGSYAFYNCDHLETVTIPDSVTSIGEAAFSGCSALISANIPESVKTIGKDAFADCGSLLTAALRIGLQEIGSGAFRGCSSLTYLAIPDSVTTVGSEAFADCGKLQSVVIGRGVGQLDVSSFSGCSKLESFLVAQGNACYHSDAQGVLFATKEKTLFLAPAMLSGTYTVPDGVEKISAGAFENCSVLQKVILPDSVAVIEEAAFQNCTQLTGVTLGNGLKKIHRDAFMDCPKLQYAVSGNGKYLGNNENPYLALVCPVSSDVEELVIADTAKVIASGACMENSLLKAVHIPASVETVGDSAFMNCTALSSVTLEHGVKAIGSDAFDGCSSLQTIEIPNSVTDIGEYAFAFSGLTSVTVPGSITVIQPGLFWFCQNLHTLIFEEGITHIHINAFDAMTNLKTLRLPNSLIYFDYETAQGGRRGTFTVYEGGMYLGNEENPYLVLDRTVSEEMTHITIHPDTKLITPSAFYYVTDWQSITLPDGIRSMPEASRFENLQYSLYHNGKYLGSEENPYLALVGVTSRDITELILHPDVEVISGSALAYCSNLTSLVLPENVKYVVDEAFRGCSSLRSITVPGGLLHMEFGSLTGCTGLTDIYVIGSPEQWQNATWNSLDPLPEGVTVHYADTHTHSFHEDRCAFCGLLGGYCSAQGNLTWTLDDSGVFTVSGTGRMSSWASGVNPPWYAYRDSVKKVILEEGVTSIGGWAFNGCRYMTDITIPTSLTEIGSYAFYRGGIKMNVHIADLSAWLNISGGFEYYNIPKNGLYLNGTLLTDVVIPQGITHIRPYAFDGCALTSVTFSDAVTEIGEYAFSGCKLTSVVLPEGLTTIGTYAFSGCSELTSVSIPESVTAIGSYAFNGCKSLRFVAIPEGITAILTSTFYNCTKLTAVVLPASLERIETYAFYNCADLRHVTYTGTAKQWEALPIGSSNTYLTNAPVFHFETGAETVRFEKNCVNSGLFCELCYDFIQKDHQWSGTHAYGEGADLVCDDCGYARVPRSAVVSRQPKNPEITLFTGKPDLTGAMLAVTCSDGSVFTVPVTGDMLGSISNTQLGELSVPVTAYGCQAELLLQVVPGIPESMTLVQLPGECSYVLGDKVHAEGILVEADYGKYGKVILTAADLPAPKADTSKVGKTAAVIALGEATVEFEIYVHEVLHSTLDDSLYPESSHNYAPDTDDTHCFTYIGARSITVTFDPRTMLENQYDFLYVYDGSETLLATYTADQAAGQTLVIPGDTFYIRLVSDGSVNKYGYSFSSIVVDGIYHPAEYPDRVAPTCTQYGETGRGICSVCGEYCAEVLPIPPTGHTLEGDRCCVCGFAAVAVPTEDGFAYFATLTEALKAAQGSYVILRDDVEENVTATADAWIDLNGFDIIGDFVAADGAVLHLFDSATADYTAENRGKLRGSFTGDMACGFHTPEAYGHDYRYLVLQEEDGSWSSHRYYLTVRSAMLMPWQDDHSTAINYKTVFRCNELAAAYVSQYGLQLTGDETVYANHMGWLTLEAGSDADNAAVTSLAGILKESNSQEQNLANGQARPTAQAYIWLKDGTVLTSAPVRLSAKEVIAAASRQENLTQSQKNSLAEMYHCFRPLLECWADTVELDTLKAYAQSYAPLTAGTWSCSQVVDGTLYTVKLSFRDRSLSIGYGSDIHAPSFDAAFREQLLQDYASGQKVLTQIDGVYYYTGSGDGGPVTYKVQGDTVRVNCDSYLYLSLTRTAGNQLTVVQCEQNRALAGLVLTWNEE